MYHLQPLYGFFGSLKELTAGPVCGSFGCKSLNTKSSFLGLVTLCGKLLKILMTAKMYFSENAKGWHLVCEHDAYSLQ